MAVSRTGAAALVAALAAAGIWLASGFLMRRPAALPAEPLPVSQTEVGREMERLAQRTQALASRSGAGPYRAPTRNPFRFGAAPGPRAQAGTPTRTTSPDTNPYGAPVTPPARPPMQLVGMAEDPGPDGPIRRAVIVASGEVIVAGKGDVVAGRFRVTRIDPEVVELEDVQGGPVTVLALR